ncbi:MAG TPA: hypothetical protein VH437_14020 [Terriglobales bacterium]
MLARTSCMRLVVVAAMIFGSLELGLVFAQQKTAAADRSASPTCHIEAADYKGWHAQQLSNRWVQLVIVPQNGGRVMQITFADHPYFFVNPEYEGKYMPPNGNRWFNYGGDKLWLLPEGNDDEQHWAGGSDVIDDGPYSFRKLSEGQHCEVELTGPADPRTGIQFLRTISIENDSPRILFRATMKNITGHPVEWSMQSVSQYDTSDSNSPTKFNRDFRTFAPTNAVSGYLNRYHVRFGPAENPSASIREDGLFTLRYVHMAAELWLDSTAGWLAVVDGSSRYAMVERFRYQELLPYPGKASIIFWTNGPEVKLSPDGIASLTSGSDASPHYLEAEINSPMCRLRPGESCSLETEWFPTRVGSEFHGVTDAGIVVTPLRVAYQEKDKIKLTGSFGVFFAGHLVAHLYDQHGSSLGTVRVAEVDPTAIVSLVTEVTPEKKPSRVSLHLEDENGLDRGAVGEVRVESTN